MNQLTGNDLRTGAVVWWTGADWSLHIEDAADVGEHGEAILAVEEMKADLVSLFAFEKLAAAQLASPERLAAVHASGILRVLNDNRPRRDQPYQLMQLVQFNWFLDKGLLTPWDGQDSGQTQPLISANALIVRDIGAAPRAAGELANYIAIA